MHIFLQGPKRIGKSTVISKTLELLAAVAPLSLGGFFTWNGGKGDPRVYMRPAPCGEGEGAVLASYDAALGRMVGEPDAFERDGVRILSSSANADLIIMDELGFLESGARLFQQAVFDILEGDAPVLGVLRLGEVAWHERVKLNARVTLVDVSEANRDGLPRELAAMIRRG